MIRSGWPVALAVLLTASSLLPGAPAAKEQPPEDKRFPLTLAACYRLTVARSEADQIRAEELRAAEARYRAAVGGFLPEFGLFASKVRNDTVEASRDPARDPARDWEAGRTSVDPTSYLFRHTPTTHPFFAGAFVRLPLFNGFRNYYEAGFLRHETERQRHLRVRARQILYQDLAALYFQVLEYESTLSLLRDESEALQSRVAELARDRRLGRARPSEVLTAQADLAASRAEAENTRGLLRVSRELLAFLVGRPADSWRLVDDTTVVASADLESYLRTVGERQDVLAALVAVRARRETVRTARAGHLPSLSVEGSYYLRQSPDTGRDWTVALRLELPLFSGGRTSAGTDVGLAELRASELDLARVRRSADSEVRSAYGAFVAGSARSVLLEEAARLYDDALRAQRTEYRYGLVRNLEVLDAMRRLFQARRALVQARHAAKLAQVRLHVAAGGTTATPASILTPTKADRSP